MNYHVIGWSIPLIVAAIACVFVYLRWRERKGHAYALSLSLTIFAALWVGINGARIAVDHFCH